MNNLKPAGKFYEEIFHWCGWFSGGIPNSKCLLRLYSNDGRIIAFAQQLPAPSGTSITNDAENLATLVFRMCQEKYDLSSVDNFQWIEFYPKERNLIWKDSYELLQFTWDGKRFSNPNWI